jgi:hypothetical protein
VAPIVTSDGPLKRAVVPVASVEPAVLCPANVVTAAAEVILRMALFPVSATKMLLDESTLKPDGPLNCAFVPVPEVNPDVA